MPQLTFVIKRQNIYKICLASMFSAIGYLLLMVEIPWFTTDFLRLDLSDVMVILTAIICNFWLAVACAVIKVSFKFITMPGIGMLPGHVSELLGALTLLISFWVLWKTMLFFLKPNAIIKPSYCEWHFWMCLIISAIFTSVMMVIYNATFLLNWYGYPLPLSKIIIIFLPFNIAKYLISAMLAGLLLIILNRTNTLAFLKY